MIPVERIELPNALLVSDELYRLACLHSNLDREVFEPFSHLYSRCPTRATWRHGSYGSRMNEVSIPTPFFSQVPAAFEAVPGAVLVDHPFRYPFRRTPYGVRPGNTTWK